jgi:ABC-type transport system involved in multi-copper enzyme maturation permease subunit
MRLLRMIFAEWRKLRGRGLVYAVLLFGLLHGVFAVGLLFVSGAAKDRMSPGSSDALEWTLAGDFAVWWAGIFPFNAAVLLVLFAILWAEDLAIGTAAMILVRPVRRIELFAAKAVMGMLVVFGSILLALLTAASLGLVLFGVEGDPSQFAMPVAQWLADVDSGAIRMVRILWGAVLATVLLLPALAFSALFGAITKSPLLTLAGSLLALFADAGITAILWAWSQTDLVSAEMAGTLKEWTIWSSREFYNHHGTLTLFADGAADLGRTLGYSAVILGLALVTLQRRDIR